MVNLNAELRTPHGMEWLMPPPASDGRPKGTRVHLTPVGSPSASNLMPSMGNRKRFLAVLANADGPVCDDCAAAASGFAHRQTAFQLARDLSKTDGIGRAKATCAACGAYKNASWTSGVTPSPELIRLQSPIPNAARPWFWEGNVQARIVDELNSAGSAILSGGILRA